MTQYAVNPETGERLQFNARTNAWEPAPERTVVDKLTGQGGERYQTWPERLVRGAASALGSAVTLPGDVLYGKVDPKSDEALQRSLELATIATPINPAFRSGVRAMGSAFGKKEARTPSAEELRQAGKRGYEAFRESGLEIDAQSVKNLASKIESELIDDGIIDELAPSTYAILRKLQNPPEGGVATAANLHAATKGFRKAGDSKRHPAESPGSARALEELESFIERPPAGSVLAGSPAAASKLLKTANRNYAAGKRSERLTEAVIKAERRAKSNNSGRNVDNAIRQNLRSVIDSPKKSRGYSPEEIEALERVVWADRRKP